MAALEVVVTQRVRPVEMEAREALVAMLQQQRAQRAQQTEHLAQRRMPLVVLAATVEFLVMSIHPIGQVRGTAGQEEMLRQQLRPQEAAPRR